MYPAHLSRYRVIGRLAEGGTGVVYLGEDPSLGRKVALKFLLSDDPSSEAHQGLVREARAAAQLDHPFICKVYEVGEHDGQAFIVMEYVEGVSVAERVKSAPFPVVVALRVVSEIAEALQFAHERGIVHRDVKPANVMLDSAGHVKVMDFGIAMRLARPVDADAATLADQVPGRVTGTLAYMSPEQLRGDAVDPRSDVFSLGIVLQEILTGSHPFSRSTPFETASAILSQPPASPALPPDAPAGLHAVIAQSLQKDPHHRYQSMDAFRQALESVKMPARRPTAEGLAGRRPAAVAAAVAVVIAGIAIGAPRFLPVPSFSPTPALAFAERDWVIVTDFNNLTGDPVFDRSLRLGLEVGIGQSKYVNLFPINRVEATLLRMQRSPSEALDERRAVEIALREGIRAVIACDIAQLNERYSLTLRLIDPHTRLAVMTDTETARGKEGVLDALGTLAARVRERLGESLRGLSQQQAQLPRVTTSSIEALKLFADTSKRGLDESTRLTFLNQAIAIDPGFALAHAELGRWYYQKPDRATREKAEAHFVRALELTDRLTLRERLWIQAIAEDSRGNRERAVDGYAAYLAQYPDDTRALFRKSWTEMAGLRRLADAAKGFERLVKLDPTDADAQVNLATALGGQGEFSAAIAAYGKAFELNPKLLFGTFINHEYGFNLVYAGRADDAEAVFARMKVEGETAIQSRGFRSAALLQMLRGRYTAAAEELRTAVSLDQAHQQQLSELRDRMFLASALEATSREREANTQWSAIDRLVDSMSLSPEFLWNVVSRKGQQGRARDARRYLGLMEASIRKPTADSGISRNVEADAAYFTAAEAAVALAEGRPEVALERIQPAHVYLKREETLFVFARAAAATGRLDVAAARFEELLGGRSFGDESQELWLATHLHLGEVFERQDKVDDAKRVYQSLVTRWNDADPDVVLLRDVRRRLARLEALPAPR